MPEHIRRLNPDLFKQDNNVSADTRSISECNQHEALVVQDEVKEKAPWLNGPIVIRFVRHSPRLLDRDNFIASLKGALDSLVTLLGRKGDSERDGVHVEYYQIPSKQKGLAIEIRPDTQTS